LEEEDRRRRRRKKKKIEKYFKSSCLRELKRPFWKLPRLICKNEEALRKAGVLAYRFDTP